MVIDKPLYDYADFHIRTPYHVYSRPIGGLLIDWVANYTGAYSIALEFPNYNYLIIDTNNNYSIYPQLTSLAYLEYITKILDRIIHPSKSEEKSQTLHPIHYIRFRTKMKYIIMNIEVKITRDILESTLSSQNSKYLP